MKKFFSIGIMFFSFHSFAYIPNVDPIPGKFYAVYICDNGAMTIDKVITGISGGYKSVLAQVVIRNPQIIEYFVNSGAVYSQATYNEVIFGNLYQYPGGSGSLFYSNPTSSLSQAVLISEPQIQLIVNGSGSANWTFRNCQRTEYTELFN